MPNRIAVPLVLGIATLAIALFGSSGSFESMLVPRILLYLIGGLSLLVCAAEWFKHAEPMLEGGLHVLTLMCVLVLAGAGMAWLGFIVPMALATLAVLVLFGRRRLIDLSAGVLGAAVLPWFLFHHVLLIRLPTLLTNGAF